MAEILTTLALRPRMHVIDRDDPRCKERVVAQVLHVVAQCWCVQFVDGYATDCGARHTWLDVTR